MKIKSFLWVQLHMSHQSLLKNLFKTIITGPWGQTVLPPLERDCNVVPPR